MATKESRIVGKLSNALTVEELIDELSYRDPKARVVFEADYGDRGHTMQALAVCSVDDLDDDEEITETAYSASGLAISEKDYDDEAEGDEDDGDTSRDVVVLR